LLSRNDDQHVNLCTLTPLTDPTQSIFVVMRGLTPEMRQVVRSDDC
jgi:hypothetical protein